MGFSELGLTAVWSDDEVKKFLVKYDTDGDGVLDFQEFKALCKGVARLNRKKDAEEKAAVAAAAKAAAEAAQKAVDAEAARRFAEIQAEKEAAAQQAMLARSAGKRVTSAPAEVVFMDVPSLTYSELKTANEAQRALRKTSVFNPASRGNVAERALPEEDFSKLASQIAKKKKRNASLGSPPPRGVGGKASR